MASSRDDFIIAIRSAFLKKSTKQKFSLLTLVLVSAFIIILSNLDFKVIRYLKIGINEIVYRSSFIVSIPENFIKNTFIEIRDYSTFFVKYKKDREELNLLKSKNISSEIIQFENKELKELINDYVSSFDKVLAKIIVDQDSPFLKSIIINKGSKDNIKIGTNIYDQSYLVGRVIEVNYKTSRVLLLSDLNSNVPVTIAPQNTQAIITGSGDKHGEIKYIKDGFEDKFNDKSIVYTSGTGAIFKSGIPIGRLIILQNETTNKYNVEFYSDFSQLKYVFAEIEKKEINQDNLITFVDDKVSSEGNLEVMKLKLLNEEIKILDETNKKFIEENKNLVSKTKDLNTENVRLNQTIKKQIEEIKQNKLDQKELEFLRLNLLYSSKCQKSVFKKGYRVGTPEYRKCILNKGNY